MKRIAVMMLNSFGDSNQVTPRHLCQPWIQGIADAWIFDLIITNFELHGSYIPGNIIGKIGWVIFRKYIILL